MGFGGRRLADGAGAGRRVELGPPASVGGRWGAAARELEAIGYPVVWIPETLGNKEVFSHAAILLGATTRLAVASGIANIHARDPMAMANGARALGEAYPGRFVLGIGVSHAPSVATRGGTYGRPIETMRAYLDAMDAAPYGGPEPTRRSRSCSPPWGHECSSWPPSGPTARTPTSSRPSTPPSRGSTSVPSRSSPSSRPPC